MKTIKNIMQELEPVKPGGISRRNIYRYFTRLKIRPLGVRQRPQIYPDDAPARIREYLGIPHTLTMRQLKDVRRRSLKARSNGNGHSNGKGTK